MSITKIVDRRPVLSEKSLLLVNRKTKFLVKKAMMTLG